MKFYSQEGEDRWLWEHNLIPPTGFYVDIGAAWPAHCSNTALLRDLGWCGIQVDGCDLFKPMWEKLCLRLIVAVVSPEPEVRYAVNAAKPGLSRISPKGNPVLTKTLNQILSEESVGRIDLLNVDTEGSEHSILSGFDFGRHSPRIIIWEYNTLGVKHEALKPFLEARGYRQAHKTQCNYIHVSAL